MFLRCYAVRPRGGYILWISLPGGADTLTPFNWALAQNISIAPGIVFSNSDQFNHCLRLNCGIPWNRATEQAVMTLGVLARQLVAESARNADGLKIEMAYESAS